MKKKLKKYELKISAVDNAIVSAISLVEEPAIESNFIAFAKEYEYQEFAVNEDRYELLGASMIPDQLIYRVDKKTGEEFNVFFSKETIREIAQQYFKSGFQKNMNMNHSSIPADSYIFQSFIVDNSKGVMSPKNIDAPDGSWIVGIKVDSEKTWSDIKSGKVKGFSIEGIFQTIESNFSTDSDNELLEILNKINQIVF